MKEFVVCFKSGNHVGKLSVLSPKNCWALCGLRNAYHGVLCACGPWGIICINMQGQRWSDVTMLLIPMYGVWVFCFFSVLSSEAIHIYACKMLMCLLMARAIGLMEREVPRAVSQFSGTFLSFQNPHISLVSRLISVSAVFFLSALLYLLVWVCWVQLLPRCCVVESSPWILPFPFSQDAEPLVRLLLVHVQPTSCCHQGRKCHSASS